jgi:hypothetical protein
MAHPEHTTIPIHPLAPAKAALGAACMHHARRRVGLRWIAAGIGCDSSLEVEESPHAGPNTGTAGLASTTMSASDMQTHNPGRTVVRHPPA